MSIAISTRKSERAKIRELRRMKLLALGFLVGAAIVFVITRRMESTDAPAWVGFARAAAEAGMVGGIADWFAVTALFRHPLGIPVPHTAIIPKRKDAIAASLSNFVGDNFLNEEVVREKISHAGISGRVGTWLSEPENAEKITAELSSAVAWVTSLGDDDKISEFIEETFRRVARDFDVSVPLATIIDSIVENQAHVPAMDLVAEAIEHHLFSDPQRARGWFDAQLPQWLPGFVNERAGEWIYDRLIQWVDEVRTDHDHPIRLWLERGLVDLSQQMRTSPDFQTRVNEVKMQLVDRAEIRHTVSDLWLTAKRTLNNDAQDANSPLRVKATEFLVSMGSSLRSDEQIRQTLDFAIENVAAHVVNSYRDEIAGIITDTIARWDAGDTSRKIELQVGKDLQFIRVNGTVVGALAGVVIYGIGQLISG